MIGWAIAFIVLAFFVPITAYAQSIEELAEQGIIENDKSIRHIDKMTDIQESCTERIRALDIEIFSSCVEITRAYNQAMSNLFSQHRDTIEGILYE